MSAAAEEEEEASGSATRRSGTSQCTSRRAQPLRESRGRRTHWPGAAPAVPVKAWTWKRSCGASSAT